MEPNGISKFETGYWVRLHYVDDAPTHHKFFSFQIYGGERGAMEAAKTYRRSVLRRLKVTGQLTIPYGRKKPQKNNSTGYLGITYNPPGHKNGANYKSFFIDEEGIKRNLSFAISRYGNVLALRLAILTRKLKRRATESDAYCT